MSNSTVSYVDEQVAANSEMVEQLARALTTRTALVGVIGMGYVGLPLTKALCERGFVAIGFDIDQSKVDALNVGQSYIRHVPGEAIRGFIEEGRLAVTSDFGRMAEADAVVICVPTPLTRHREPDLGYVVATTESIARSLRRGQLIVLESTSYPGTTSEVLKPILEATGLKSGCDFFIAYSPEREDPGNIEFSASTTPKVIGGDGPEALRLARLLYDHIAAGVVVVSSPETAEAVKLTENIFRSVNIALVNELKVVFNEMGIDVWEVIDAAKTKPFGFMPFYPGPGLGGHCIPIDPFYLTWKAREYGLATRFIELAGEINTWMPRQVVSTLATALDKHYGKGLNGSRVLVLGIAYKKNVDDLRESPALSIMDMLEERGAEIAYNDNYFPEIPVTREHPRLAGRRSVDLEADTVSSFDAVLIATNHDQVDYRALVEVAKLVVDTRNATKAVTIGREKIVKA